MNFLIFSSKDTRFNTTTECFQNIVGKGEIAPFPTMFSTRVDNCILICPYFCHHIFAAELQEPKIGILSKGLTLS